MRTTTRLTVSTIALLGAVTIASAQPAQAPDPHHPADQSAGQMRRPGMQPGNGPMAGGPARPGGMGMGPGGATGGQAMMTGDDMAQMLAMMQTMHGQMMRMSMRFGPGGMGPGGLAGSGLPHVEGRIAFFKAELAITDAQTPQWNTFAEALRAQAARMRQAAAPATPLTGTVSAPEQLERRIAMLASRSEALQAVLAGMKPLYAVLTDDQKKTADTLMAEHFMTMRRGG
jgi:hypothetical protein